MAATSSFITITSPTDGTVLTDSNCCYVDTISGSDSNSGTRLLPKATLTSASALNKPYILFKGTSTENPNSAYFNTIIFDNPSSRMVGTLTCIKNQGVVALYGINCTTLTLVDGNAIGAKISNCIIGTLNGGGGYNGADIYIINSFIETIANGLRYSYTKSITTLNYKSNAQAITSNYDYIIVSSVDLYNYSGLTVGYYPIFNNSILRKALVWKWGGVIVPITYTTATGNLSTDSAQWKTDIFNGLTAYYNTLGTSTSKTYLASILSNWSIIFPSTTMVVDDINCCPIFNRYDSGSPVDYSLKISDTNLALTMSSVGSYVGAYKASITPVYDLTTLKELDSNGVETSNTADILVLGINGTLYPSPSATQYRNRIKTNVLSYTRGYNFEGVQSMLTSGLAAHYQFGKYQSYTTTYIPQESIEVEPYDSATVRGTFPNFSAKLNGYTQMWYNQYGVGTVAITTAGAITGTGTAFTTNFSVGQMFYVGNEGHIITAVNSATSMTVASWSVAVAAGSKYASVPTARINTPLLFSDLAGYYNIISDLNITEYGTWAVTNADFDSYYLYSKTGVQLTTILLKYFKFWVNINYYE